MRRLRPIAAGLVLVLAVIVLRVIIGSMSEYQQGDWHSVRRDWPRAVAHYERAVRWYVPGNPYPGAALHSLYTVCEMTVRERSARDGFDCFSRARGALKSIRGLYQPYADVLVPIERRLTELSDELGYPAAQMRAALDKTLEAHPGWSLLAALGLVGWILGLAALIWTGVDPESGRLRGSRGALAALCGILLGFGAWLLGLFLA